MFTFTEFVYICLHFSSCLFTFSPQYAYSCLFTFCKLFVYNMSAVCLLLLSQLFTEKTEFVYIFTEFVYITEKTESAVCLHLLSLFTFLFTESAICLHY